MSGIDNSDSQTYYHGTKADLAVTNKRFPGNTTKSYRSRSPLRIIGEIMEWKGHSPDELKEMHDHLEHLKQRGVEAIEE